MTTTSEKIPQAYAARLSTPYDKPYNFTTTHTVTVPHPLATVFPVLAHGKNIERGVLCYGYCSDFELYHSDTVQLPSTSGGPQPLTDSRMRLVPSSASDPDILALPRQWFRLQETIPLLCGLHKQKVEVVGCQTWDDHAKVALYESVTDSGIVVWKLRTFEEEDIEGEEGKGAKRTRVTELIKGISPGWMRWIVQREAGKAHV